MAEITNDHVPLEELEYLREEKEIISKDLFPSLPKEKGWILDEIYQYQGFWYSPSQLMGVLNCQRHFKAMDNDLILVTTPKSGTTWLKAMAFAVVNRVHDNHGSSTKQLLLTNNSHNLIPYLERTVGPDGVLKGDEAGELTNGSRSSSMRLLATHMPYSVLPESVKDTKCKIVYLCRDPKDTFISFWHFTNKMRSKSLPPTSLEEDFDRFCRGAIVYGSFWDHVLEYWKLSLEMPEKVCFLKYEEMRKEPKLHLLKLAEFLGYPFSEEEAKTGGEVDEIIKLCSFQNMSNLEVNKNGKWETGEQNNTFFRRGEIGDYVNYLTPEMIDRFDKITEEKLESFGLKL